MARNTQSPYRLANYARVLFVACRESENTQVWNRLGKHPCLSIVLCCEKHDKMECRVCKPPKISWDLYRRVTPNDPFKWHCGTADTASNLAYILKGYHGDGLIMQCLLSRLTGTNGRKELRLTHPNARIDRMKRHCFQHMWFPKFNERLQSLSPAAAATPKKRRLSSPSVSGLEWPVTVDDSITTIVRFGGTEIIDDLPVPEGYTFPKALPAFRKALKEYGKGSSEWNPGLRGLKDLTKQQHDEIKLLRLTLESPPSETVTVFRGSTQSLESVEEMARTRSFCDTGFFSTSLGGIHQRFWEHNCHFIIKSKNGKFIRPFVSPNFATENEILHCNGTSFTVLDIKKPAVPWLGPDKECFLIWLEEVQEKRFIILPTALGHIRWHPKTRPIYARRRIIRY
eukprot:scaffold2069_cov187-Amphora_coffeaeformis.AAC.30